MILYDIAFPFSWANQKHKNNNPVAENAIQELKEENLCLGQATLIVSQLSLSLASARLDTEIRKHSLSDREM